MVKVGLKTFNLKKEEVKRKWFLVDAEGVKINQLLRRIWIVAIL